MEFTEIKCRQATHADIPILLEFEQGVVDAERPFNPDLKKDVKYYDLDQLIQSEDSELLVAELNGKIIGSGYVRIEIASSYFKHDRQGYIGFLYVEPAYRRRGCIQLIMKKLKEWVKSKKVNQLYLEVYAENEAAVRAYEKFGFKRQIIGMNMPI